MREREPVTRTMRASEVRQQWSQLINSVFRREARILVEKSGIPVAAVISAQDLERLTRFEEDRGRDFAILDEVGAAFKDVPPEELEHEVARALADVRAEHRGKQPRRAETA
jgi:prevent-host-death family protein